MNERIKELAAVAGLGRERWNSTDQFNAFLDRFAESIVVDCIYTVQLKIVRNGDTPENLRSREHVNDLAKKFDITLPTSYKIVLSKEWYLEYCLHPTSDRR